MPSRWETWVLTVASETTRAAGDLGVGEPGRQQAEHLALAVGQRREVLGDAGDGGRQAAADLVEQLAGDGGREDGVAGGDGPHGGDDLGGRGVLQQEAAGPGAEGVDDVLVEAERRQDQDPLAGRRRVASMPSITGMRMSISTTSGRVLAGQADRLGPVGGLGDDDDVASRLEHGPEPGAHHRLVVGDHDAAACPDASGPAVIGVAGAIAVTSKPWSSRGRAVSVPPNRAARSRIPITPCPPDGPPLSSASPARAPGVGTRVRPLSVIRSSRPVGAVADGHLGVGAAGVLDHVRQRLLDDPEGRELDSLRQRSRLALDGQLHLHPARPRLLDQLVEVRRGSVAAPAGRPRRRRSRSSRSVRCISVIACAAEVGDRVGRDVRPARRRRLPRAPGRRRPSG